MSIIVKVKNKLNTKIEQNKTETCQVFNLKGGSDQNHTNQNLIPVYFLKALFGVNDWIALENSIDSMYMK